MREQTSKSSEGFILLESLVALTLLALVFAWSLAGYRQAALLTKIAEHEADGHRALLAAGALQSMGTFLIEPPYVAIPVIVECTVHFDCRYVLQPRTDTFRYFRTLSWELK